MNDHDHWHNASLQFRAMQAGDIPEIVAIEKEAFPTPWSADAFYNELHHNMFAHYLVMELNHRVAGYGGMWIIMGEAHITNIAVHRDFRGKKLGNVLMQEIQDTARMLGASKMTLEVRVSNLRAQNLYKKFGFRDAGVRKGYYSDNKEDALIMWANL
ncbi:MAG: ribosomal-protein-alanine N-acetyltransferase [Paenibacillus sp. RIFOXYA1_FULL_44_5]|nr:MAG: ribosomal-protein-alanine N-acetyltransferase [Paenibacillus sp. RIFOXYA1_FULL_44_5]